MELFSGDNIEQFEIIKSWIYQSDIFMLILGARYGTVCSYTNKSYTHMEYEYALSINKPIAVFVMSNDFIYSKKMEAYRNKDNVYDENVTLDDDFRKLVCSKMVSMYENIDELKYKVATTIAEMQNNNHYKFR